MINGEVVGGRMVVNALPVGRDGGASSGVISNGAVADEVIRDDAVHDGEPPLKVLGKKVMYQEQGGADFAVTKWHWKTLRQGIISPCIMLRSRVLVLGQYASRSVMGACCWLATGGSPRNHGNGNFREAWESRERHPSKPRCVNSMRNRAPCGCRFRGGVATYACGHGCDERFDCVVGLNVSEVTPDAGT